jgi:hypothetical protein
MVGVACASVAGCGGHGAHVEPDASLGEVTIKTFPDGVPSFTGRTENAMLVAFQDGDGPWIALTGTGGVYQASPRSPRYGVAVGCSSSARSTVALYYQSISDPRQLLATGCHGPIETAHVSIDLRGLPGGEQAEVWFGASAVITSVNGPIGIETLKAPGDVFARSYGFDPSTGETNNVRTYRGPTLDPQSTPSLQIDLAASGKALEFHPLTIADPTPPGAPSSQLSVRSSYLTPNSQLTSWPLHATGLLRPVSPDRYATLDVAMRQPDDVSSLLVRADSIITTGAAVASFRIVRRYFKDPVAQSVTLPDIVAAQAPVVDKTAAPWITATIPIVPSRLGNITYEALFAGTVAASDDRVWTVAISAGWAAGQSSVTASIPDLSNLPGWRPEMALDPAAYDGWNIGWIDRNMPIGTPPVDGRESVESLAVSVN